MHSPKDRTESPGRSLRRQENHIHSQGRMADAVRAFEWGVTPLDGMDRWCETDVAALDLMLSCRFPALLLFGPQLIVVYNDEFVPLLAEKHPRALGMSARETWAEAWEVLEPQLLAVLHEGKSFVQENVLIPVEREGRLADVYWSYHYSPVYEKLGAISGVFVVCHDVTQEYLAERERDALAARLEQVLELTTDSVLVIDRDWTLSYRNVQAALAMGPLLEVVGKNFWECFPDAVYEGSPFVEHYERAMEEGVAGEFSAFYPEPLGIWVQVQVRPFADGIVVFFRDVTEQRRTMETLIKTEKLAAVGRLAASIAHEINNPLEAVTNLLYLARHTPEALEVDGYLMAAEEELRRVAVIANQTLKFHKQASSPQPVSCAELMDSVLSVHRGRIANARVTVERRERCRDLVICFEGEIRQVLTNLIGNAVDAMTPEGGRLLLRSKTGCDWRTMRPGAVFTVADTGSGIDAEVGKRIFDPFFTTKGFNGTGLGLWVSHEIAQRHNGELRMRSRRGEPSGTVFTLFLPMNAVNRDC